MPRDVASRAAKERCDAGYGVNKTGQAVYLDFADAIIRYGKEKAISTGQNIDDTKLVKSLGREIIKAKYGNLFQMYEKLSMKTLRNSNANFSSSALHNGRGLGRL